MIIIITNMVLCPKGAIHEVDLWNSIQKRLILTTVSQPEKDDLVFEHDGARLYVPLQAMPFIDGTEVDYVREGLNQLFKFNNPKAQNECGCGESFGV